MKPSDFDNFTLGGRDQLQRALESVIKPLTESQLVGLRALYELSSSGRPPTVREIAGRLGYTSLNAVADLFKILTAKGLIERLDAKASGRRRIVFTEKAKAVLGVGTRGPYTLAEWDSTDEIDVDRIRETIIALEQATRRGAA